MKKIIKILSILLIVVIVALIGYFFIGSAEIKENIVWGVDFSQSQAEYLRLDWKELYLAIINDLKVKNIKLHTNWNWVEGKFGDYYFDDIDWQIRQAENNDVDLIYVLGMKTGRWPECHMPEWAKNASEDKVKSELLDYIAEVVERYKNSKAIAYWQIENEPLFKFGECPDWYYRNSDFLKQEVALVKQLDPSRQVIISDSGELSSWINATKIGDIVGVTMYRNSWSKLKKVFNLSPYTFLSPRFYAKKAGIIEGMFNKKVICIELQAEPWVSKSLMGASLEEQLKSMNQDLFKKNIQFAKKTGFDTFYLWGVEWWYQLKTQKNHPEIWQEAQNLF